MSTTTSNRNFALIIGVGDYSRYDESAGLPPGTSDLPGARNDVRAWYETCLAIGFSPENIRVLCSPEISPSELGPGAEQAIMGSATRAHMIEGLQWLGAQLDTTEPVSGLFCFSGHGLQGDENLPALCPSDTTVSLEQVIEVAQLEAVAPDQVKAHLTVMLDSCHAQVGKTAAQSLYARLRASARLVQAGLAPASGEQARIVSACRWDQASVVARFQGLEMGAFTWAMTSTLGQWSTVIDDGVAYLDLSYGQLVDRSRGLLESLSFGQESVLSGPANVLWLAYLQPGIEPKKTYNVPMASRKPMQLDGGSYQLTYLDGNDEYVIANILVPSTGSTETWTVYPDQLEAGINGTYTLHLYNYQPLTATGTSVEQTTPATTDWTSAGSTPAYPAGTESYLSQTTIDNTDYDTSMSFSLTTDGDDTVLRTILWYNSDNQGGVAFDGAQSVRVFSPASGEFPSTTAYEIDSEFTS